MANNQDEKKQERPRPWEAQSLVRSIKQVLKEFEIRESSGVKDTHGYILPGWPILNQDISGLRPGTLTLVGSWKGYYRKEFMMEWCSQVTKSSRKPSLYQSFEFPSRELILARIARESSLPYGVVATGKLLGHKRRKEQLQAGLHQMASYQGLLHLSSALRTADISGLEEEICRIGDRFNGIYPTLFIDRLNGMEAGQGSSNEERLCILARQLKCLALKYSVPIVAGVDFNKSSRDVVGRDTDLEDNIYVEQMTGGFNLIAEADHAFTLSTSEVDSIELSRILGQLAQGRGLSEVSIPPSEVILLGANEARHAGEPIQGILYLVSYDTGHCSEICSFNEQVIVRFSRMEKIVVSMEDKGIWFFPEPTGSAADIGGDASQAEETQKVKVSVKLT